MVFLCMSIIRIQLALNRNRTILFYLVDLFGVHRLASKIDLVTYPRLAPAKYRTLPFNPLLTRKWKSFGMLCDTILFVAIGSLRAIVNYIGRVCMNCL